jgi:hypothetical protein
MNIVWAMEALKQDERTMKDRAEAAVVSILHG